MTLKRLFEKFLQILQFIETEADKPLNNDYYETKIYNKGYRDGMIAVRDFIWNTFNSDDP
ncbi:hypothetical protein JOC70_000035 [Clostridium pascui]|uniref:hypothetical protein n=1 Tax=Clostridium pascui TaxID=46609 RepID=UPI00195E6B20|nr:hypothetical protein [Clostridium pascui]MBM7868566.1 hypothetical protein [Clostridium pascui]